MTVKELTDAVNALKAETRDALLRVLGELNKGQRSKLLKDEKIKAFLERYGVFLEDSR